MLQQPKIVYQDGCTKLKFEFLTAQVFGEQGRAMLEFKRMHRSDAGHEVAMCRFCGRDMTDDNHAAGSLSTEAFANVCDDEDCVAAMALSCTKVLPCGHLCCGVKGTSTGCVAVLPLSRAALAQPLASRTQTKRSACLACMAVTQTSSWMANLAAQSATQTRLPRRPPFCSRARTPST